MSDLQHINVVQVGVGGTGSYLVPPLKRFLMSLVKSTSYTANYYLVDNDTVEEKNTLRQNFNTDDIGKLKCEVFKDDNLIQPLPIKLEPSVYNLLLNKLTNRNKDITTINVIVGCVDTIQARVNIADLLELLYNKHFPNSITFYVDSGNYINTGQSYVFDYQKKTASEIKEEINKYFVENKDAVEMDELPSCTNNGDQSIAANFQAASLLYNIVTEILVYKTTSIRKISFMRYSRELDYDSVEQLMRGCI